MSVGPDPLPTLAALVCLVVSVIPITASVDLAMAANSGKLREGASVIANAGLQCGRATFSDIYKMLAYIAGFDAAGYCRSSISESSA